MQDRQHLAGNCGITELPRRIIAPVIRRSAGIGKTSLVQMRDAVGREHGRKCRPAIGRLRLAIEGAIRRRACWSALDIAYSRLEGDKDPAINMTRKRWILPVTREP
jgi:hypothetical protein